MGSRTWKRHERTRKEDKKMREFASKHFRTTSDAINTPKKRG